MDEERGGDKERNDWQIKGEKGGGGGKAPNRDSILLLPPQITSDC
jgi:hypothetical protein